MIRHPVFFSVILGFLVTLLTPLATAAGSEATATEATTTHKLEQRKETLTIKNKLATAEGRVSDLISRLDSVSDDASRAKNEIHTTLMEVWKVVDLLGRDQCGDVVEKVRISQKKAENKAVELQEEVRAHLKDIEGLKLQIAKSSDSLSVLQRDIAAERKRREALEGESRDLRDKLQWANAVSNETQKYDEVAKRLQSLLVTVTARNALLERVVAMNSEALTGSTEWRGEIEQLTTLVRQTERDFSSVYKIEAMDSMKRDNSELEDRLRDSRNARDKLISERDALLKENEVLKRKARDTGSTNRERERVVVRTETESNWAGWISFGLMSAISGGFLIMFMGVWQDRNNTGGVTAVDAAGAPGTAPGSGDKYGFTPTRTSPGGMPSTSPMTYVNGSGGNRTPGSRGSTPRRY